MLFFIFVAIFVIGLLAAIFTDEWSDLHLAALCTLAVGVSLLVISAIGFATSYIGTDASIAKWETQYESLTYQLENNLYDNDDQNVITLPRDIIRDYIDGGKFVNEIPCDSEGRELATLNQNASKANDNW